MKRNAISLLVAALVLIGLIAFVSPTAEAADPNIYHCLCGNLTCDSTDPTDNPVWKDSNDQTHYGECNGEIQEWAPWTATSYKTSGYYYFGTIFPNQTITSVRSLSAADKDIKVDLYGHDVVVANNRAIGATAGTWTFCNSLTTGGTFSGVADSTKEGAAIKVTSTGSDMSLSLYGIDVEANASATGMKNGGAIYVTQGQSLNMYRGSIAGCEVSGNGGALLVDNGRVYLEDVEVTGGTAKYGGNIYIAADAELNMYGCSVSGGSTGTGESGGNMAVLGTVYAEDCTFTGGSANKSGGNIYVTATGALSMKDTAVSGGQATQNGGNVLVNDNNPNEIKLDGCTVSGGVAANNGGNIWLGSGTTDAPTVVLADCTISGGSGKTGGSIVVARRTAINGGTVENGTATNRGGNLFINNVEVIVQLAAKISGGNSNATSGGNVYITGANGKLTMHNTAEIAGGKTSCAEGANGGNVYVNGGSVEMDGSSRLTGGQAYNGGNVYLVSGTSLTMEGNAYMAGGGCTSYTSGGTVVTANGGNAYIVDGATFTMKGSTQVRNGMAKDQSGNFHIGGTLNMSGSAQVFGGKHTGYTGNDRNAHVYGALIMSENAKIAGGVNLNGGSSAALSGNVYICEYGNHTANRTIYIASGVVMDATGLTSGAKIDIGGMAKVTDAVASVSDPAIKACFTESIASADYYVIAKNDGKVYLSATAPVAQVSGYDYTAVAEAVTAAGGTNVVKLMSTVDGAAISESVVLDLNGNSLTNVTVDEGVTVSGMDSTTNQYSDANCGTISGTINGTVANLYQDNSGTTLRRYLAVPAADGYSFHRIYVAVTAVTITPADTGLHYKTAFIGDETVAAYINDTANVVFGLKAQIPTYSAAYAAEEDGFKAYDGGEKVTENYTTRMTAIQNVMKETATASLDETVETLSNNDRAALKVTATAFVGLTDASGNVTEVLVESSGTGTERSFQEMVQNADTAWNGLGEALQKAMTAMYTKFYADMNTWTGIDNVKATYVPENA